jgi:hypothetical protein
MRIQEYLDGLRYNTEADGETFRSPRRVLRDRTANCIEGAVLAAGAFRFSGQPPLIMDLTAVHDEDHVIAVFRRDRHWGAIGTSKFTGLRFREPVYRTLRELAMSYFEHYYNLEGERTLRGYGRPVNLAHRRTPGAHSARNPACSCDRSQVGPTGRPSRSGRPATSPRRRPPNVALTLPVTLVTLAWL